MNLPRRSMSEGLQTPSLPPEALSLIREGRPSPKPIPSATSQTEGAQQPQETPGTRKETDSSARHSPTMSVSALAGKGGTVSRSFRLPEKLPSALLRVATERRINGTPPFTQEEIVTEAITEWLKKNA